MAADKDFMGREDKLEPLFLSIILEFREQELIVGQQQTFVRCQFDSNGAGVRIARPTVG